MADHSSSSPFRAAIVGAGLSGLACARRLQLAGLSVIVLEKSRSLAGRCATRAWRGHVVDKGAQYFTIQQADFQVGLQCVEAGNLAALSAPVVDGLGAELPATGGQRWYHRGGNNQLGHSLARALDVRLERTVASVAAEGSRWKVGGETVDAVILSSPWPQTARILGFPEMALPFEPCLTALLEYDGEWAGKSRDIYGRIDRTGKEALAWSACENHKTGRVTPGKTVFVAQASAAFSREFLLAPREEWVELLRQKLEDHWELPSAAFAVGWGHRWRYARREGPVPELPTLPQGIFVTGDSRCRSRVEEVWRHGVTTAADVLRNFGLSAPSIPS